jgi:hypothetical protein
MKKNSQRKQVCRMVGTKLCNQVQISYCRCLFAFLLDSNHNQKVAEREQTFSQAVQKVVVRERWIAAHLREVHTDNRNHNKKQHKPEAKHRNWREDRFIEPIHKKERDEKCEINHA